MEVNRAKGRTGSVNIGLGLVEGGIAAQASGAYARNDGYLRARAQVISLAGDSSVGDEPPRYGLGDARLD